MPEIPTTISIVLDITTFILKLLAWETFLKC